MIAPYRIVWNGVSSVDIYLLTELSFDEDNGAASTFLNRESVSTERYDGSRKRIHSYKYNEILMPKITFIKEDYSVFTMEENRSILSWLTGVHSPQWIEIYHDDSNVISYRMYGNFCSVEAHKLSNGQVIGYECEFESNAPYAWSRKYEILKNHQNSFTIDCSSDEYNKLVYPKITITLPSNNPYISIDEDPMDDLYEMMEKVIYIYQNTYYIKINGNKYTISGVFNSDIGNQTSDAGTYNKYYYVSSNRTLYKGIIVDGGYGWEEIAKVGSGISVKNTYKLNNITKSTEIIIIGNIPGEVITLDCENKIISSSITPMRIIGNDFNWEWIGLAYGTNTFDIVGDCSIKFEYVEPVKLGSI